MTATGTLFTVSAPSGAGKTSLVKALVDADDNLQVSVSHTTRAKRPGETDGVNYHFVGEALFKNMLREKAFLEYATVFGNYYGTSRNWVETTLATGTDVILEIDWQGAAQVKAILPETLGIFIIPPSLSTLQHRLDSRGQDDRDTIARRIAEAKEEISHFGAADYLVVNDDFEQALSELQCIITSQRLSTAKQQQRQASVLAELLS